MIKANKIIELGKSCDSAIKLHSIAKINACIGLVEKKLNNKYILKYERAYYNYYLGNLYLELSGLEKENINQWRQGKNLKNIILAMDHMRQARLEREELKAHEKLSIETNLANL